MSYLTLSEIGERVKEKMQEEDLTQSSLANQMGISQSAVSRALNGERKNRSTLFRLAEKIGFKVSEEPRYLFEEASREE